MKKTTSVEKKDEKQKGGGGLVFYAEPATKAISRQCSQLCKQME